MNDIKTKRKYKKFQTDTRGEAESNSNAAEHRRGLPTYHLRPTHVSLDWLGFNAKLKTGKQIAPRRKATAKQVCDTSEYSGSLFPSSEIQRRPAYKHTINVPRSRQAGQIICTIPLPQRVTLTTEKLPYIYIYIYAYTIYVHIKADAYDE